ncbi:MAG: sulfotransferase [Saprospiraceae bacterium]|nr:sulfotransferase [Saprospiraceae bacterium]
MAISIGGAPGTGSSLLRQMLNRHPDIYCGPETNLFAFPALFSNWPRYRSRLPGGRRVLGAALIAPSIRVIHETRLAGKEQTWSWPLIREVASQSESFELFCSAYFAQPCAIYQKRLWAEKTPANVLTFTEFLHAWENGIVVHMMRDPKDTIASLLDRGMTLFEATSRYLFNCAHALKMVRHRRSLAIRYEDLVSDPARSLMPLLTLAGLNYDPAMAEPGNPAMEETDRLKGWQFSETERPQTGSVGRFQMATDQVQAEILAALQLVHLQISYARSAGLDHTTMASCAEQMGYHFKSPTTSHSGPVADLLRRQEKTYRRKRLLKDWWYERNKPMRIADL